MTPRLLLPGREMELPALEPPDSLVFALDAALEIRQGIREGRIRYSPDGLTSWLRGGSSQTENRLRMQKFQATKNLLQGRRLDAAEEMFGQAYRDHIETKALAKASLMIVREKVKYGHELVGLRDEARAAVEI